MRDAVTIVVFARDPVPGQAKTRLIPALGPAAAADLYRCFLLDRMEQLAALAALSADGGRPVRLAVAHTPDDADISWLIGGAAPGAEAVPQGPGDLSDRLVRVVGRVGCPAILLDSDSPSLPPAYVAEAVEVLSDPGAEDVVVGPADDGGYYLVGLRRPAPELFADIPWSTPGVLRATLARAEAAGLSVRRLPSWFDVDKPADLDRLRAGLHAAAWPPRTAEWLRELPLPRPVDGPADPDAAWVREASRCVYGNAWIRVREDRVLMPTGVYSPYGVLEAHGAVGILPFLDPATVLMVRQYRYVSGHATWEMPTGGRRPGEAPEEAARRELREETAHDAARLTPLGAFVSSKSVVDERCVLYVGEELVPCAPLRPDPTEIVRVEALPYADVLGMVLDGAIEDSMTIVAVQRHELRRRGLP